MKQPTALTRKTPMKRTAIKPVPGILRTAHLPEPKLRRCKAPGCREMFRPAAPYVTWHSPDCGAAIAMAKLARIKAAKAKIERKKDRARKEAMKSRTDWMKDAQRAFNAWVRRRDELAGRPCICCGKPFEPQKLGGSMDAGHYLSRGSAPHLKFDERNCHAQRKNCNRPGGATRDAFRRGMIERIGIEALEALESDQESRDMGIDDLKMIISTYRAKLKELK